MTREVGPEVISKTTLTYELQGRFNELNDEFGKFHLSVRWEPGPRIVRVGVCLDRFDPDTRMAAIETLLAFERDHAEDFAVEFDVIPLEAVNDEEFAEA